MTNESDEILTKINGFVAYGIDGSQVACSRGIFSLNLAPGESVGNRFEAPNAPCNEATEYVSIVGIAPVGERMPKMLLASPIERHGERRSKTLSHSMHAAHCGRATSNTLDILFRTRSQSQNEAAISEAETADAGL